MIRAIGYFLSTEGRTARPGMWLITGLFTAIAMGRIGMQERGLDATSLELVQIVLLWPLLVAVPIRRFHDMGRPWWWVLIFLGGMLVSFLFLMLDLTGTAGLLGLSAFSAITDTETYMQALSEFNQTRPEDPVKAVEAMGLGGVSLGAIFFFVQFGWLHLVPGNRTDNDYGPRPGAAVR